MDYEIILFQVEMLPLLYKLRGIQYFFDSLALPNFERSSKTAELRHQTYKDLNLLDLFGEKKYKITLMYLYIHSKIVTNIILPSQYSHNISTI